MYPDILGEFIMTLIEKGYEVRIDNDSIIDGVKFHIIKYESVPYHVAKIMTFDELTSMTKDTQKGWFDYFIKWAEVEFLNLRRREEERKKK